MAVLIVFIFLLNLIIAPILAVMGEWFAAGTSLVAVLASGVLIFKDSMNLLQRVGKFYWIVRDNGKAGTPLVSRGFMRQYVAPWLYGHGVQFRFRRWTLQVGTCRPSASASELEGILKAVGGRMMEEEPEDIGVWT